MNPICLSSIRTLKKKDPVSGVRAVRHEHLKICSTSVELKILPFQVYRSGRVVEKQPCHIIKHGSQTQTVTWPLRVWSVITTPQQPAGRWGGAAASVTWLLSYLHYHHHPPSTLNYLHCVQCRVVSKRILWNSEKFSEHTKRSKDRGKKIRRRYPRPCIFCFS